MPEHTVGTSDSTSALALKKGFYWKTIWEHGENSELRQKPPDHKVLHPVTQNRVSRPLLGPPTLLHVNPPSVVRYIPLAPK